MFLALARELRALGATRVEAFGCVACFGPPGNEPTPRKEPEPGRPMSPEARALADRAELLKNVG